MTYEDWIDTYGNQLLEEALLQDETILDNLYDYEWLEATYSDYISDLEDHAYEQHKDDLLEL